jgi:ComF family protein
LLAVLSLVGRSVERAVLPAACVFCGAKRALRQKAICDDCYVELPWIDNACARCANPVATRLPDGVYCAACQLNPPPFIAAIAPLTYTFPVDAAIKAMKFRRKLFYVPAFAHILTNAAQQMPADIDGVLPVPLHWRRHAMRGFNQAAEMSKRLQRDAHLQLVRNVIRRRATSYQSGLAAAHRRRNLEAAFLVRGTLDARHVLIVDDVITTGETCRQLAQVLLDAGVNKVSVLAVARAQGQRGQVPFREKTPGA